MQSTALPQTPIRTKVEKGVAPLLGNTRVVGLDVMEATYRSPLQKTLNYHKKGNIKNQHFTID